MLPDSANSKVQEDDDQNSEDDHFIRQQNKKQIPTFGEECKRNFYIIKEGLKVPEMYKSILWFIITGFAVPVYSDFLYYYKTEIAGITQF